MRFDEKTIKKEYKKLSTKDKWLFGIGIFIGVALKYLIIPLIIFVIVYILINKKSEVKKWKKKILKTGC